MSYYLNRAVKLSFDEALKRITESLAQEGFGILTEIDVQATLKKKIGAEMPPYRILGACNPTLAHQGLLAEDKLGVMLPCNVIVRETEDGRVEIASIDPAAAMERIGNPQLTLIATQVREKLQHALDRV